MRALETFVIYVAPFLIIGIAAKLLMKRKAVDLSDVTSVVAMLFISSQASASDIRRVVTGLDANNKSTAMFDSHVPLARVPSDLVD